MIGFIKYLIRQYKEYKITEQFSTNIDDKKEKEFIRLFSECESYGFRQEQILYILRLISCTCKGE